MNTLEIKSRLHERIEHLSEAQLKKLDDLLAREFSQDQSEDGRPKERKLGTMKGKIRMADNWDSEEENEEIARSFYEGDVFPDHE
jgi:hypothetical protein